MNFKDFWPHWLPSLPERDSDSPKAPNAKLLSPAAGRGLAGLAFFGALLLLLGKTGEPEQPTAGKVVQPPAVEATIAVKPEDQVNKQLRELLSQMAGVGRVDVFVTYETDGEQVIAEETTSQRTVSNGNQQGATEDIRETRRPVTVRDDAARAELPLVLVKKAPQIRGVVVVADGAGSASIRYNLARAVETALGVPAHRVAVFARE